MPNGASQSSTEMGAAGLLGALGFSHLPENDLALLTVSELIPLAAAMVGLIWGLISICKATFHFIQWLKESRAKKTIKAFPIK